LRDAELWIARTPPGFAFNVKARPPDSGTGPAVGCRHRTKDRFAHNRNIYYKGLSGEIRDDLWDRFECGFGVLVRWFGPYAFAWTWRNPSTRKSRKRESLALARPSVRRRENRCAATS